MTQIAISEVQQQYDIQEDVNIFNPEVNIRYGILLLHHYYAKTRSVTKALILYNSGYAGLARYNAGGLSALPQETQKYVAKVSSLARANIVMFDPILPERDEADYIDTALSDVYYELFGTRAEYPGVIFEPVVQGLWQTSLGQSSLDDNEVRAGTL
jgi:phage tail protein X